MESILYTNVLLFSTQFSISVEEFDVNMFQEKKKKKQIIKEFEYLFKKNKHVSHPNQFLI